VKLLALGFNVNVRDAFHQTAAHTAARDGHIHVLKTLVRCSANITLVDVKGYTPLHVAAQQGHSQAVSVLLQAKPELIDEPDMLGNTALHWAAAQGHTQVVLALMQGNAAVLAANNNGYLAIHYAARSGCALAIDVLMSYGGTVMNMLMLCALAIDVLIGGTELLMTEH
jgi:ankyrin repeat protein